METEAGAEGAGRFPSTSLSVLFLASACPWRQNGPERDVIARGSVAHIPVGQPAYGLGLAQPFRYRFLI